MTSLPTGRSQAPRPYWVRCRGVDGSGVDGSLGKPRSFGQLLGDGGECLDPGEALVTLGELGRGVGDAGGVHHQPSSTPVWPGGCGRSWARTCHCWAPAPGTTRASWPWPGSRPRCCSCPRLPADRRAVLGCCKCDVVHRGEHGCLGRTAGVQPAGDPAGDGVDAARPHGDLADGGQAAPAPNTTASAPSTIAVICMFAPNHRVNWLNGLPCRSESGTTSIVRRSRPPGAAPAMISSPSSGCGRRARPPRSRPARNRHRRAG